MSDTGHALRRFFGALLVALGLLIAVLSGACTLIVSALGIAQFAGNPDDYVMVLLFGGIPFVIGLLLLWAGRSLLRRQPSNNPAPPAAP